MKLFVILWFTTAFAYAQSPAPRNLHVATWPAQAEIFADSRPIPSYKPAHLTPHTLLVNHDSAWVRLHLFKLGYADTIIDVRVPTRSDNYLMIQLRHNTDPVIQEQQESFLSTRKRHSWGRRLLYSSLAPALAAAGFAIHSEWSYTKAKDYADQSANSIFTNSSHYQQTSQKYDHSVADGDRSLKQSKWALGIGTALLVTGFILTF